METGLCDIRKLADLLSPREESESDEFEPKSELSRMGPGAIGAKTVESRPKETDSKKTDDIWSLDEVKEGAELDDTMDPRKQPEYEMFFKQKVTTEDIYLQMGNKTPASFSCEDLVIKIKLPGVQQQKEIHLDVNEKKLDCRTSNYRLGLFLPHPVDPNLGKAEWDEKLQILTVTLRMNREYDMFNF